MVDFGKNLYRGFSKSGIGASADRQNQRQKSSPDTLDGSVRHPHRSYFSKRHPRPATTNGKPFIWARLSGLRN